MPRSGQDVRRATRTKSLPFSLVFDCVRARYTRRAGTAHRAVRMSHSFPGSSLVRRALFSAFPPALVSASFSRATLYNSFSLRSFLSCFRFPGARARFRPAMDGGGRRAVKFSSNYSLWHEKTASYTWLDVNGPAFRASIMIAPNRDPWRPLSLR